MILKIIRKKIGKKHPQVKKRELNFLLNERNKKKYKNFWFKSIGNEGLL